MLLVELGCADEFQLRDLQEFRRFGYRRQGSIRDAQPGSGTCSMPLVFNGLRHTCRLGLLRPDSFKAADNHRRCHPYFSEQVHLHNLCNQRCTWLWDYQRRNDRCRPFLRWDERCKHAWRQLQLYLLPRPCQYSWQFAKWPVVRLEFEFWRISNFL